MDHLMSKEESYADRRKLFKNIWETSMHVDEKDDIINKPKIIKTLRLDEMDRCIVGKKKKQRIKNLRTVCNKLLDFCDRQDADDLFYEQMVSQGVEPPMHEMMMKAKKKQIKVKKGLKKAKSMFPSSNLLAGTARVTTSEKDSQFFDKTSRNTSPITVNRTSISFAHRNTLKPTQSPKASIKNNLLDDPTTSKKVKKKRSSRNKTELQMMPAGPKVRFKIDYKLAKQPATKKLIQLNKITIQ